MKLPTVIITCFCLIGSALAQTLTVRTDPPGLEIWRGEEDLGTSPVTIEGPFDGPVEITVKLPKGDHVVSVDIPPEKENHTVLIPVDKSKIGKSNTVTYIVLGICAGIALIIFLWVSYDSTHQ